VLLSFETLETLDALETALEMLETFCIESRLIYRTLQEEAVTSALVESWPAKRRERKRCILIAIYLATLSSHQAGRFSATQPMRSAWLWHEIHDQS